MSDDPSNQPTSPENNPAAGSSADSTPAAKAPASPPAPAASPAASPATSPPESRQKIKIGSQRPGDNTGAPPKAPPAAEIPGKEKRETHKSVEQGNYPPPRVTRLSDELENEINEALGDLSIDHLITGGGGEAASSSDLQPDQRVTATVVKIHREDVFLALPGHQEGMAPHRQFINDPEPGDQVDVNVVRLNTDDGLYECTIPGAAAAVQDWGDISDGMVVDAVVTAHNTGGLECEVNGIRAFMPVSQIALFRVEDLEQFVGQKFTCVVIEANPDRRNLVISRRGVLERERAENQEKIMQAIEVGQTRDGVVRSIKDFGAFVDLGGVDGLIHVSKLSWDRVAHPSEILEEGQKVQVKIESIDSSTGRIGLSYRDLLEHPWQKAAEKYAVNSVVTGTVSKIMDFGAFVRLEAGIEGLVHISELAHHRVNRVSQVVEEGQQVDVKVLSIDPENQRMSLSIKANMAAPVKPGQPAGEDEPLRESAVKKFEGDLQGGTNKKTGGEQFGLKW